MAHIKGVVVGTVVDVNDPNGEGRIRVDFPWMGGQNKLYWAPVATLMTGSGRGSWFMPEVGDEVLVAFEHEDAEHPFVLGFLWNGQQKPPETSSHKRLVKSVKGHTILLDDSDGGEKIEITTGSTHLQITMDDTSNSIKIKASQQVTVEAPQVSINSQNVQIGQGATHPAVWGDTLVEYLTGLYAALQLHVHPGELALGIFPVTPAPASPLPPVVPMLSGIITEA